MAGDVPAWPALWLAQPEQQPDGQRLTLNKMQVKSIDGRRANLYQDFIIRGDRLCQIRE
jgi:hypothetical protein